eukprot:CAMPEP_0204281892 /NCGR_PEP_ID=MMETSP0468-20130131/42094_1 /ASSEMBLY_ACC=CAM_ASM_000383 /TAXON_ID=2969 /ORGANISM="Oxyrrhis marina" /LENGTH=218 /DNA_ID=CAMNT_0051259309 /DNA_START=96 /DNA_END=752 /DNA_ORIENTATION=-
MPWSEAVSGVVRLAKSSMVVQCMLAFIYAGDIRFHEAFADLEAVSPTHGLRRRKKEAARAIADAAHEYLLPEMAMQAETQVWCHSPVDIDNLAVMVGRARKMEIPSLEERCLDFISEHFVELMGDRALWQKLPFHYREVAFDRMSPEKQRSVEVAVKLGSMRRNLHSVLESISRRRSFDRRELAKPASPDASISSFVGRMPNLGASFFVRAPETIFDD